MIRADPSQTTLLRRAFARDIRKRFEEVRKAIIEVIATKDALGLVNRPPTSLASLLGNAGEGDGVSNVDELAKPFQIGMQRGSFTHPAHPWSCQCGCRTLISEQVKSVLANVGEGEWRFLTDDRKVEEFQKWLQQVVDAKVLAKESGQPFTKKHVEKVYKKGLLRAYTDSRGRPSLKTPQFFEGSRDQFLRTIFNKPETLTKIRLLAARSFESIKGVTQTMSSKMNQILSNGVLQGKSPQKIASEMSKSIRGLSKVQAQKIANTEIVHAQSEAQLDGFEELGEDSVGVYAEWATAGDGDVCPQCKSLEGTVYTISAARGLIPLHPNCRCAWIPATQVDRNARRMSQRKLARAKSQRKSKG